MEHVQGQPGADRAVGRPGPAARMTESTTSQRPRPSVLIPPVAPGSGSTPPRPQAPVPPAADPGQATPDGPAPSNGGAPAAAAGAAAGVAAAATVAAQQAPPAPAQPAVAPVQAQPQYAPQPQAAPASPPPRTEAARIARSVVQPTTGPRSARVYLTHIDPWSVMKQAFLLAMALAVVLLVAAATLWFALDSAGVLDAITRTATDVGGESGASLTGFLDFGRVMGVALVVAGVETVLLTALATLFAFLYNLAVGIGGGLELTLSEDDL